jgi:hypothetical protein
MTQKDSAQVWGVITGIIAGISMQTLFPPHAHPFLGLLGYFGSFILLGSKSDSEEGFEWWIGAQAVLLVWRCAPG